MSDCDTCNYLEWDDDDGQYYCIANVDEDDYARMMLEERSMPHQRCPYWVNGDEYALVRHQAF